MCRSLSCPRKAKSYQEKLHFNERQCIKLDKNPFLIKFYNEAVYQFYLIERCGMKDELIKLIYKPWSKLLWLIYWTDWTRANSGARCTQQRRRSWGFADCFLARCVESPRRETHNTMDDAAAALVLLMICKKLSRQFMAVSLIVQTLHLQSISSTSAGQYHCQNILFKCNREGNFTYENLWDALKLFYGVPMALNKDSFTSLVPNLKLENKFGEDLFSSQQFCQ